MKSQVFWALIVYVLVDLALVRWRCVRRVAMKHNGYSVAKFGRADKKANDSMPATSKISTNEFTKSIREGTERVARDHGWNVDKSADRGYAFQQWFAEIVAEYETRFETDADDSMQFSRDLGADLVFDDPNGASLLICQCKFTALSKRPPVKEEEVTHLFSRHKMFMDRDWVLKHASERASALLADYSEKVASGYSVTYRFVTTGNASDKVREVERQWNDEYAKEGLPVTCELMDFAELKEYFVRVSSLELTIPASVKFHVQKGSFFSVDSPHPTMIASISGNALREMVMRYKESLFAYNIRGYLGGAGINKSIRETAEITPEKFFYFNNGVSAICTKFEVTDSGDVTADDFQIINGAQTVGALRKASANPDIQVLFRLTKTEDVKTIKGFNRDVIRFNNTQNVVKISDFRSNDPIQVWLEDKFRTQKARDPLPNLRYVRRREAGRRSDGKGVKLEDLAKMRYAFFCEPTQIHAAPKSLWTHAEDGGFYEWSFGVNGELQDSWSDSSFDETLSAIAIYLKIEEEVRRLGKTDAAMKPLMRLRFHILGLAGELVRDDLSTEGLRKIGKNKAVFTDMWDQFFMSACDAALDGFEKVVDGDMTAFAFVRSAEEWDRMKTRFRRKRKLAVK